MSSTRYIQFSITTPDGTSSIRFDDRRLTDALIDASLTVSVGYNNVGTSVSSGELYNPKMAWAGYKFLLDMDEYVTLQGLIRRQNLVRQTTGDHSIIFDNVLYPFVDPNSTRTRAIASGGVTTHSDGTISYFARHYVEITGFSMNKVGSLFLATMDWAELDYSA
jgi:hypothetical protein